jgi:hypothetical protein
MQLLLWSKQKQLGPKWISMIIKILNSKYTSVPLNGIPRKKIIWRRGVTHVCQNFWSTFVHNQWCMVERNIKFANQRSFWLNVSNNSICRWYFDDNASWSQWILAIKRITRCFLYIHLAPCELSQIKPYANKCYGVFIKSFVESFGCKYWWC